MRYSQFFALFFALLIISSGITIVRAGDEPAPTWLQQASTFPVPSYSDKDVPAVVLLHEQTSTLNADGMLVTTTNYVVRLLKREGKYFADARVWYLQSSSKVRDFKAWLIRPGQPVKFYGKDKVTDMIADPDDIYNEYRVKSVDAEAESDIGSVFGYQSVVEERPLFTQDGWNFQRCSSMACLPTLLSRFTLNLPSGWQANSITFNRAEIKPAVNGSSYVWEARDLQPVPPEPDSPKPHTVSPRIVFNYHPASGAGQNFNSWRDVSVWGTQLHEPSVTLDDNVAAKARELTANAKTELEKIRALAVFVQNLRYISVDIGIGKGNGYRPRPANLVLQRGFGDCKDKANLMRTMLKALKIEAYPVFIYSGDPTYVREEWSSPFQFNHCIIAIKVSDETVVPTVIKHETLGRLLIFDATDPYTMLGDLPDHEQGSFALVAAGADGKLMKMPILPPDANKLERLADVALLPDGTLQGTIREQAFGQTAMRYRAESRALSASAYRTRMESWLTRRVTGAKLSKFTPNDYQADSRFELDIEFAAPAYAQIMQGRLMMFKPAFVGRLDSLIVSDGKRVHPVLLDSSSYNESIKVKLPEGFIVDEMPEGGRMETAFGKYSAAYEVKDGFLTLHRSLTINKSTVVPDKYEDVKTFFAQVRAAESEPVVLLKK